MKTMKLVAAAAVAAGLIASPAFAKDHSKDHMKRHHVARAHQAYQAQMSDNGYRNGPNSRADSGFWPADVAAGAVGGAVGIAGAAVNTAGQIATAPFRAWDDSYASYDGDSWTDNGWNNNWNNNNWTNNGWSGRQSYAQRNNFVCQPGTWFRGQDGRNHICQ